MTRPALIRFLCLGCSNSLLTWASDSSPLIARTEWPNAIRIPIRPMRGPTLATNPILGGGDSESEAVSGVGDSTGSSRNELGISFGSQPRASRSNWRLCGAGESGVCLGPLTRRVIPHHTIIITTIAVVIFIILRASPDDSWIPLILRRQKYRVATTAIIAER